MSETKGKLIVISAPSGTGKGTIINKYIESHPQTEFSISCTSRARRSDDTDKSYYFVTKEQFEEMIHSNELFEYVEFCGNYYGTPKKYILENINQSRDVILDIEYVGALKVKESFEDAILIFVLPPSFSELERRLKSRGSDTDDQIGKRMRRAIDDVAAAPKFDYLVINDNLDDAVKDIDTIIEFEKVKNDDLYSKVKRLKIFDENNVNTINKFYEETKNYNK